MCIRDSFYPITLVTDIDDGAPLVDQEQFGPVLPIVRYRDLDDAVVFLARPERPGDADKVIAASRGDAQAAADADAVIAALKQKARAGDHVVFMSNGGFDGAPRRFLAALQDG